MCLFLGVFVTLTIASEFYRGARVIGEKSGTNLFSSAVQLTRRNTRRYGGYVVHFGMVLIFIGIAGQPFNRDVQKDMPPGSQLSIGPYTLLCQSFDTVEKGNYQAERATIEVLRKGRSEMILYPERRFYPASQVTGTIVAIRSTPLRDLYVVFAGRSPETGQPVIHAYLNPLVKFIWFGGIVVALGTLLGLMSNSQAMPAARAAIAGALLPREAEGA